MKKLFYIALLINFLLVPFQYIVAESFADADDIFKVLTPTPNSKVGGNINIEWSSFDDDQTTIPYYVELLDGSTCKTTSFGRINTNSASTSSQSINNKISWDTHKTISTQSLNDGNYCLQICSAFKNTNLFYSICNSRNITVVNVNKLRTITSAPSFLTINENELWQYQVKASDVDSDSLKYYLVFAPDFLEINGTTGLIKTKENNLRISGDLTVAEYRVVVGVDDKVSGTTTQEFTIRIEKGRNPNPANPNGGSSSEPPTTNPQNTPAQISFNTPKENDELKGVQNFVDWSIYDPDGIQEVTLNYSEDLETWTEVISKAEDNFSRYSWDVSGIEDGKYYLQLKVKDKKDEVVAKTSKPFYVKNSEENQTTTKPLIINIKPENTKSIDESPANITGDFAPAEGEEIDVDSFRLTLNDKDLTQDCVKNEAGFQCTVKDKLSEGNHQIIAEISDLNGNSGTFESSFNFKQRTVVVSTPSGNSNSAIIIVALILLLIVLIGLPWFFIGYSKRRLKNATKQPVHINIDPPNYAYPQATVTIQNQPAFVPTPVVAPQQQDQSKNFSDFMSNYSFNQPQQSVLPQPVAVQQEQKKIGEVKPQKPIAPKTSISDSFKNLKSKVSSFIPKATEDNIKHESKPVEVSNNPTLGQNIQMAYSGGTSATKTPEETFVEPKIVDEPIVLPSQPQVMEPVKSLPASQPVKPPVISDTYVTPTVADQSEEELKRMYPELYGTGMLQPEPQATNPTASAPGDYYEPTPKD